MYEDKSVSVFSDNTYQNLGQKTFWFFLSQKISIPIGFLVLALILSVLKVKSFIPAEMAGILQFAGRISFALFIIGGIIAFFVAKLTYRATSFMLGEDALTIKRGILTTEEYAIPYRQIQNIEIERTLAQRTMGISRLIILTASDDSDDHHEEEGVIPSIDKDVAEKLKADLLKKASVQKVIQA